MNDYRCRVALSGSLIRASGKEGLNNKHIVRNISPGMAIVISRVVAFKACIYTAEKRPVYIAFCICMFIERILKDTNAVL